MPKNTPITFDSTKPSSPYYNDSHHEWRDTLRGWLKREIAPHVEDWEEAGEIPLALYKKASEFGLTRRAHMHFQIGTAQPQPEAAADLADLHHQSRTIDQKRGKALPRHPRGFDADRAAICEGHG